MEKVNKNKLCGSCDKPCERPWCITLEKPETFPDYDQNDQDS